MLKGRLWFFVAGMSGPPERSFNFEGDALIKFPFRLFHNSDRANTIIVFNSRRRTPKRSSPPEKNNLASVTEVAPLASLCFAAQCQKATSPMIAVDIAPRSEATTPE